MNDLIDQCDFCGQVKRVHFLPDGKWICPECECDQVDERRPQELANLMKSLEVEEGLLIASPRSITEIRKFISGLEIPDREFEVFRGSKPNNFYIRRVR